MNAKEIEQQIIAKYQEDEEMMILVFAQWCVNNELDPIELYERAYPTQGSNPALKQAIEQTVPKEEASDVSTETVLVILSLFGNDDLAQVVTEATSKH